MFIFHTTKLSKDRTTSASFLDHKMLLLEGRIIIFKTLAISKIVFLAFLTVIPNSLIKELQKIQKMFIWHSSRPKISQKTLSNNFENGGLKHVDISYIYMLIYQNL